MTLVFVHAILFIGAFLQGVTGMGFALIVGPVLLLVMGDGTAIQIAGLLSLAIALALFPGFYRHIDGQAMRNFCLSGVIVLPLGLLLFALAEPVHLKLGAGLFIAVMVGGVFLGLSQAMGRPGRTTDLVAGTFGGIFGGALSMPGPPIAMRLATGQLPKVAIRATILGLFVVIYPLIFAGQALVAGLEAATLWSALAYTPATLAGAIAGHLAVPYVSEDLFRRVVIGFQIATAASLLADVARTGF